MSYMVHSGARRVIFLLIKNSLHYGLQLMVEFGICYPLKSSKTEAASYLFPSLCPIEGTKGGGAFTIRFKDNVRINYLLHYLSSHIDDLLINNIYIKHQ